MLPSVTARALSVMLRVHDKHKVRQEKVEVKALSVCKPLRKQTRFVWTLVHHNVSTQQGSFCPSMSVFVLQLVQDLSRLANSTSEQRFSSHAHLLDVALARYILSGRVTDVILCVVQIHSTPQRPVELKSALRRRVTPRRSSYALSQEAGPRYLFTSGIVSHGNTPLVAKANEGRNFSAASLNSGGQ